jgi:hypothetical protein
MPGKSTISPIPLAALLCAVFFAFGAPARADSYAYMGGGNDVFNFGVVDLSTGVFSFCGATGGELSGLGVGPDHQLYGGRYLGNNFYRVNLANGALTLVGTSNITYFLTGSTTKQLYGVGFDSNLYTIDATTGAATLVGPLGIPVADSGWWGLSTNSATLYFTHGSTLYRLSLKTGAAHRIGTAGAGVFGAEVSQLNILYAVSVSPLAVYTLNPATGASQLVANLFGQGTANPGALAPIRDQTIRPKDICNPHRIP